MKKCVLYLYKIHTHTHTHMYNATNSNETKAPKDTVFSMRFMAQ